MKKNSYQIFLVIIISLIMMTILSSCNSYLCNSSDADKDLYLGTVNENYEQINEGIEGGADINKIEGVVLSESNPLKIALIKGRKSVASYLIKLGADPNYIDKFGVSLLMFTAYNMQSELCKLLLEYGADIDYVDKNGYTVMEYIISNNSGKDAINLMKYFLEKGSEITPTTLKAVFKSYNGEYKYHVIKFVLEYIQDKGYESELETLLEASVLGDLEAVKDVINDEELTKEDKELSMFYSIASGNINILKLLLDEGVDMRAIDKMHNTTLMIASSFGELDIVKYLLDKGINLESSNLDNNTALIQAVINSQYEVAEYLIRVGARMQYGDGLHKRDVLVEASGIGDVNMIELLLDNKYPVNSKNLSNVMNRAVVHNQVNSLKYLLDKDLGVDLININDCIFEKACYLGHINIVKLLSGNDVDINGNDGQGGPLSSACSYARTEVVEYLVSKGVNVNAFERYEENGPICNSALMNATYKGLFDVVKLLVKNGADLNQKMETSEQLTPLCLAARRGSKNILKYLIEMGADINYQNKNGKTPLMIAVEKNLLNNIKIILDYEPDMTLKDNDGQTVLDIAKNKKNTAIITILEGQCK